MVHATPKFLFNYVFVGRILPHNMKIDRVFSDTKMRPFFAWRDAEALQCVGVSIVFSIFYEGLLLILKGF